MTSDLLAMIAAALLSLAFSYIPSADGQWAALSVAGKRLIMLALLVLVALASIGLTCSGFGADFGLKVTCDRAGIVGVVQALLFAIMANQAIYKITPQTAAKS